MIERINPGWQKQKNAASCVSAGQLETKGGYWGKYKFENKSLPMILI
jgi:hypothetical protein